MLIIFAFYFTATFDTIFLAKKMASAGADAVLVLTPSYYKNAMNDIAMEMYYHAVSVTYILLLINFLNVLKGYMCTNYNIFLVSESLSSPAYNDECMRCLNFII